MANRCTLHISQIGSFESFLKQKGFHREPEKDVYEILRMSDGERKVIIYKKANAKEHLSVKDKDNDLLSEFLKSKRKDR